MSYPTTFTGKVVARLRRETTERLRTGVRRWLAPAETVRDPQRLLDFPDHAYMEPVLLEFGRETGDRGASVGNYSSLNGGTRILLGGHHHADWVSTYPFRIKYGLPGAYEDGQPFTRGRVTIGSDVWIGYDVVILSGVTIGHGAVIGAGTVVTRDVPPYAIVTGNPGELRRYRFDEPTIAALLRIAWWDWPHERVLQHVDELCAPDLAAFVAKHDPGA